jgi:hypothetical protein
MGHHIGEVCNIIFKIVKLHFCFFFCTFKIESNNADSTKIMCIIVWNLVSAISSFKESKYVSCRL